VIANNGTRTDYGRYVIERFGPLTRHVIIEAFIPMDPPLDGQPRSFPENPWQRLDRGTATCVAVVALERFRSILNKITSRREESPWSLSESLTCGYVQPLSTGSLRSTPYHRDSGGYWGK
jgi:hypothetical protein